LSIDHRRVIDRMTWHFAKHRWSAGVLVVFSCVVAMCVAGQSQAGSPLPVPDGWVVRAHAYLSVDSDVVVQATSTRISDVECAKRDSLVIRCVVTRSPLIAGRGDPTVTTYGVTRVGTCTGAIWTMGDDGKIIINSTGGNSSDFVHQPGCNDVGLRRVPTWVLASVQSSYAGSGVCRYDGFTIRCLFPDSDTDGVELRISRPSRCHLALTTYRYDPSDRGFWWRTPFANSGVEPVRLRALC
jgi:hypothetical protein